MTKSLTEYMEEKKLVNRWLILSVALVGAFAGAVLMFIFMIAGLFA